MHRIVLAGPPAAAVAACAGHGVSADDDEFATGAGVNPNGFGCVNSDHIHHNDAGGWLMADVWYEGLLSYQA